MFVPASVVDSVKSAMADVTEYDGWGVWVSWLPFGSEEKNTKHQWKKPSLTAHVNCIFIREM